MDPVVSPSPPITLFSVFMGLSLAPLTQASCSLQSQAQPLHACVGPSSLLSHRSGSHHPRWTPELPTDQPHSHWCLLILLINTFQICVFLLLTHCYHCCIHQVTSFLLGSLVLLEHVTHSLVLVCGGRATAQAFIYAAARNRPLLAVSSQAVGKQVAARYQTSCGDFRLAGGHRRLRDDQRHLRRVGGCSGPSCLPLCRCCAAAARPHRRAPIPTLAQLNPRGGLAPAQTAPQPFLLVWAESHFRLCILVVDRQLLGRLSLSSSSGASGLRVAWVQLSHFDFL